MPKFRKKPVVIEAFEFRSGEQRSEVAEDVVAGRVCYPEDGSMLIKTLEGEMRAEPGDWIIRGIKGELYPCKPDIFEATYEIVDQVRTDPYDTITINTRAVGVAPGSSITYEEICRLAGKPEWASVAYSADIGGDARREGILSKGKSVKTAPGMCISCVVIGNA